MLDILFSTNSKNALDLKNEYGLIENDQSYIREHFWPILIDKKVNIDNFKNKLYLLKTQFIDDYKIFDLELFNRYYLDSCLYYLRELKNAMSKGKFRVWDIIKDDYFHRFELKRDRPNSQTLIISDKDGIGLEIFINQILSTIHIFQNENEIQISQKNVQKNPKLEQNNRNVRKKYIAKEHALAYIFDLYSNGEQIPMNRTEGSCDAKEIKRIGQETKGFEKPDTFYRAVKDIMKYDLNNPTELQYISNDWYDAVKKLSSNWELTKQYLRTKDLIKD